MKHPLLDFIKLIFIFAATCSIGMVVNIWLITRNPVALAAYIKYGCIGAAVGIWIGAGIWLLFYLQVRRHFRKQFFVVENNYLSTNQSLTFDKELSDCRKSGSDCQAVIDKWKKISDNQSQQLDETLKDNPASALAGDKELAEGGLDMASRPAWMNNIPGAEGMSDDQARAYVQQWNSQDLSKIDAGTPGWMQFAAFASDPENQAALGSLGLLTKELATAAVSFMGRNTATATVSAADIGLKWGQENMKQSMPWENYVGTSLPADARLPQNFKTFDYYDGATKTAVSAKSLDTQTMAKLSNPNQIYSSIKGNIDAAAKFDIYILFRKLPLILQLSLIEKYNLQFRLILLKHNGQR